MGSRNKLTLPPVLILSLFGSSCRITRPPKPIPSANLLEVARHYGQNAAPSKVLAAGLPAKPPKVSPETLETEQDYMSPIKLAFSQPNYDELEKIAREARESKGRTLGGVWKIVSFYDAIQTTFITDHYDQSDLNSYVDASKVWVKARPESATARINLAQAYLDYGLSARGTGYANTVSATRWKVFQDSVALAASTLVEAAKLKDKCPYWYETMQNIARDQGWDKSQARELMELAVAFEPGYYHFYREYAYSLQTRWYGEEGELEAFSEEISQRVGGGQGDILYFEFATILGCQCDSEKTSLQNMSWPKIQSGYAALAQLYGISNLKRNRFASMAVKEDDKPAARLAFAQIGDDWLPELWETKEKFDQAKAWANQ